MSETEPKEWRWIPFPPTEEMVEAARMHWGQPRVMLEEALKAAPKPGFAPFN